MPLERNLSTLLEMSDDDLIHWREEAREFLSDHDDEELAALYQASGQEMVVRAEKAWSAARNRAPVPDPLS
jgi:succinate dehydrogenase flavin-adding protein (antitoxin of CptAB toxin-antitoxin module)